MEKKLMFRAVGRWKMVLSCVAGLVLAFAARADEFLLKGEQFAVRSGDCAVCWVKEGRNIPIGRFVFESYRNGFGRKALIQESVTEVNRQDNQSVDVQFSTSGDSAGSSTLNATFALENDRLNIRYHIQYGGPEQGFFKPRFRFIYEPGMLNAPESFSVSGRDDAKIISMDYGLFKLNLAIDKTDFGFIGVGAKRNLPMNLTTAKSLDSRIVDFSFSVKEVSDQVFADAVRLKVGNGVADVQAYLTAWRMMPDLPWTPEVDGIEMSLKQLEQRRENLLNQLEKNDVQRVSVWQGAADLVADSQTLVSRMMTCLAQQRTPLYQQAKEFNDRMHFRVGLSYDSEPMDRLDKWALFRLNFFRMNTEQSWLGPKELDKRIAFTRQIMQRADQFGASGILGFTSKLAPAEPVDVPFSHDLLPAFRHSFSKASFTSARLRNAWEELALKWIEETKDLDNIVEYKAGNEPFWSTRSFPVYGYGLGSVGCSADVFRKKLLDQHGTFGNWRKQADQSVPGKLVSWQTLDEVNIPSDAIRGLTFVDFLKNRYSSLDKLNQAWFGSSPGFASWGEVFPPLPQDAGSSSVSGAGGELPAFDLADTGSDEAAPRPRPEDIPAWTDWTAYWPAAINDFMVDLYDRVQVHYPGVNLSVNCTTGHYINDYLGTGVDAALNPWITARGLGDLSIDFYSVAFMQAYVRSLAGVAEGRPIYIQEAGGSDDVVSAAYMALYSFAYGADGLLFWRRDHELTPPICLALNRVQMALSDPDLQHNSVPVSDGAAVLYSFSSLRVADACEGTAATYLDAWQGGLLLLSKLQSLYDIYSDLQLEKGIPDSVNVLICPAARALSDEMLTQVEAFVARGGRLVVPRNFGGWDQYGRARDEKRVKKLLSSPQVLTLDDRLLLGLHDQMKNDHDPRPWGTSSAPEWSGRLEKFMAEAAPSTVQYKQAGGQPAYVLPAARRSDKAVYAFVDPWAENVTVTVRGDYSSAVNLYTGDSLSTKGIDGRVSVEGIQGPAVLKFIKK